MDHKDAAGLELKPGDYFAYSAKSGNSHSLSFGRIHYLMEPTARSGAGIRYSSVNNWYGQGRYLVERTGAGNTRKLNNIVRVYPNQVPKEAQKLLDETFEKNGGVKE